jgi:signal peptidase I
MSEKPYYEEQGFQTSQETRRERRRPPSKRGGGILEFLVILLVSFALVFGFVRPFVVEAFYIPSESMVPTLLVGDRVLVNKFIYRFAEPERGDIVVFKSVEGGGDLGPRRQTLRERRAPDGTLRKQQVPGQELLRPDDGPEGPRLRDGRQPG